MTKEELRKVYQKWASCRRWDCYELPKGVYKYESRRFRELTLKDQNEIAKCASCPYWEPLDISPPRNP